MYISGWVGKQTVADPTMEYSPAPERKDILTHETTCMSLENVMLSEISPTQKDKYYMIPLIGGTQQSRIHRDKVEGWSPGAAGRGNELLVINGDRASVWEDEKFLETDGW